MDQDISEENPQETPKAEPPKTITKKEKKTRIEQGKKLAEWNNNNKKGQVKQTKIQKDITAPVQESKIQESKIHQINNNINYWVIGGTIIGGIAVGLIYFIQRGETSQSVQTHVQTPVQLPEAPIETPAKQEKDDPFNMDLKIYFYI
jgi:hypothetical protein